MTRTLEVNMSRLRDRKYLSILMQGQGSKTPLQLLLAKFNGIGGDVGIERRTNDYRLYQQVEDQRYWSVNLKSNTTGSYTINSWTQTNISVPAVHVDQNAASVAYTGENWQLDLDSASARWGTTYSRNLATVGSYATFTSPDNVTLLGIVSLASFGNMGIVKIVIDGDPTLANKLPTAQALVDGGTAPDTILVANGGSLNPTDRVFDGWTTHGDAIVADNLTAGVHTLQMVHTGHKHNSSSDVRLYVDGFFYVTNSQTLTGMTRSVEYTSLLPAASVHEYAHTVQPDGGTSGFVGNSHGYDSQVSIAVKVDGSAVELSAGQVASGSLVEVTRVSKIKNRDTAADLADVTTVYTMHPVTGLTIAYSITWLGDATASAACYSEMFAVAALFDKGSQIAVEEDVDLSTDNGTYKAQANGNAAWVWDSDGNYGALLYIPNVVVATRGLVSVNGYLWIEDRSDGTGINKIYLACAGGDIAPNDVWESQGNYRVKYFADANAALARA
jgi:hypothetical protein